MALRLPLVTLKSCNFEDFKKSCNFEDFKLVPLASPNGLGLPAAQTAGIVKSGPQQNGRPPKSESYISN